MRLIFAIFFTGIELTQPPAITYAWSQENIQAPQLLNAHELLISFKEHGGAEYAEKCFRIAIPCMIYHTLFNSYIMT